MAAKKRKKKATRSGPSLTATQRRANGQRLVQGLWLPAELVARLDAHAAKEQLSRTSIVRAALEEWLP